MGSLPLVLAGPVLRRVDARHVCVWIALSRPGDVTVTVFRGRETSTGDGTSAGATVGTQQRHTRKCGASLHVAVVDVEVVGLPPLTRHCYDVVVSAGGQSKGLKALGLLADGSGVPKALALGYANGMLPSFVTPASRIEDVRLAHASCRKSNGPGPDALAWLDDRIQAGLTDLGKAPQQLFLTGDQIYADDVGGVLLPMLAELGKDLVGTEQLPVGGANLDATYERFPALRRQDTVRTLGRLSTTDGHNHLLTYGEFAAMYCAAFSPSAWRALKAPGDLFQPPPSDAALTHVTMTCAACCARFASGSSCSEASRVSASPGRVTTASSFRREPPSGPHGGPGCTGSPRSCRPAAGRPAPRSASRRTGAGACR
ncbi:hypothetical protein [Streptomyces klenkii]